MIVALQTHPEVAADLLQTAPRGANILRILSLLKEFGADLRPTFPEVDDPELKTHFFIDVADSRAAKTLASRLAAVPGVEAAYVKPREEVP